MPGPGLIKQMRSKLQTQITYYRSGVCMANTEARLSGCIHINAIRSLRALLCFCVRTSQNIPSVNFLRCVLDGTGFVTRCHQSTSPSNPFLRRLQKCTGSDIQRARRHLFLSSLLVHVLGRGLLARLERLGAVLLEGGVVRPARGTEEVGRARLWAEQRPAPASGSDWRTKL